MVLLEYPTRMVVTEIKNGKDSEHLRLHPGKWFIVSTRETDGAAWSFAYQIQIGRRVAFRPRGHFQGRSQGLDVVARYVGPTSNCGTDVPQKGSK